MRVLTAVLLSAFLIISLSACSKKEENSPRAQTRVSATGAYEKLFGPAPTTDKGTCYGFVIYFPSAKEPGKTVPLPFFTFDKESMKKVALQRLMGGLADLKAYEGEILQPFPAGSRLLGLKESGGAVTADFSKEVESVNADEAKGRALVNAAVLTLRQFDDVKKVRILVDGKESGLDKLVAGATEQAVLPPSAPRLLSVTAMREKGANDVEEVDAFFDRPVDVKELQMVGPDGAPLQGDIYHSVFDMAAVLKPRNPAVFKEGMVIRVHWKVTDKVGRNAAGETRLPLDIKQH